jgi:hypothetical protein
VTPLPIVTLVKPLQPLKALLPIDVTPLPMVTLVKPLQLLKALLPIDVIPSVNVNKTVCSPVVSNVYDVTTSCSTLSTNIALKMFCALNNIVADSVEVTLYLHNILDPVNGLK